jgi:stage II sporulation protein D
MQADIHVGVLFAPEISFYLNDKYILEATGNEVSGEGMIEKSPEGKYCLVMQGQRQEVSLPVIFRPLDPDEGFFDLKNVTIGINFHWERKEDQRFSGSLKIIEEEDHLTAINILPLEDYLKSVISSEMRATASPEFLKAHAVISRSWLLAQIDKANSLKDTASEKSDPQQSFLSHVEASQASNGREPSAGKEHIRWYDREDHLHFDVCADDHCQRYQGITRANTVEVAKAIDNTEGQVLMYEGQICDARYSKCCGGISELFENVWEPVKHQYLTKVIDHDKHPSGFDTDLSAEENAERWIRHSPEAFCNTTDKNILSQVLNDYDLETLDFFRWKVSYTQQEVKGLLKSRIGLDLGDVFELKPVQRGVSGRLIKLLIKGSKGSLIIGKELEIRKAFSKTHLYSSAFVVDHSEVHDGVPQKFIFTGAGWGHGVGLCQIGAAVMGARKYSYKKILSHYFKGAKLGKIY